MDYGTAHRPISSSNGPTAWASVRARLLLLVLLAILPALAFALYTGLQHRQMAAAQAQQEALRLARVAASEHERLIEGVRQLLVTLSAMPSVRTHDASACSAFFADLLKRYTRYANFGVVDATGNIFCSAIPTSSGVNLANHTFYRRAVETHDFTVGDYRIGRISGVAVIQLGYPLLDSAGHVQAMVFAALDVAWLGRLNAQLQLPPGSVLALVDRNGTILARHPDPEQLVGKSVRGSSVFTIVRARGEGVFESPDLVGSERLYGFTSLHATPHGPDAYLWIGIPRSAVYAEANRLLVGNLMGLGLVGALTLVAAGGFGERLIARRVRALMDGIERVKAGDLTGRVEVAGCGEFHALALSFNEMADALQASRQLFQSVVQSSPDAIIVADSHTHIVACNTGAQHLLGYTEAELLDKPIITLIPERYREAHQKGLERLAASGEPRIIGRTIEVEALRKDGSNIPVELSLASWTTDRQTDRETETERERERERDKKGDLLQRHPARHHRAQTVYDVPGKDSPGENADVASGQPTTRGCVSP